MNFHPWRISAWYFKLSYIVAGYAAARIVFLPVALLHPTAALTAVASLGLNGLVFWGGTRIFRGSNENYLAPRSWWRMTSKPTLSRRLGVMFAVFAVLTGLAAVLLPVLTSASAGEMLGSDVAAASYAALAYLYLNSAVRQKRQLQRQDVQPAAA